MKKRHSFISLILMMLLVITSVAVFPVSATSSDSENDDWNVGDVSQYGI